MQQPIQGTLSHEGGHTFFTVLDPVHPEQPVRVETSELTLLSRIFSKYVDIQVCDQDATVQVIHIPVLQAKEALRQRGFREVAALSEVRSSFERMLHSIVKAIPVVGPMVTTTAPSAEVPVVPIDEREVKVPRREEFSEEAVGEGFPPEIWDLIVSHVVGDKEAVKNVQLVTRLHHDLVMRRMRADLVRLMVQHDPHSYVRFVQSNNSAIGDLEVIRALVLQEARYWKLVPMDLLQGHSTKLIDAAVQIQPSVFFIVPEERQADPVLKRMAYISACLHSDEPCCKQLLGEEKDQKICALFQHDALVVKKAKRRMFTETLLPGQIGFLGKKFQDWTRADWHGKLVTDFQQPFQLMLRENPDLLKDREFLVAALRLEMVTFIPTEISKRIEDKAILRELLHKRIIDLGGVTKKFQGDRNLVLWAVQMNGMSLREASPEFQADREIALVAVRQDPRALRFVPSPLREDEAFVPYVIRPLVR